MLVFLVDFRNVKVNHFLEVNTSAFSFGSIPVKETSLDIDSSNTVDVSPVFGFNASIGCFDV
jgi:hypothetical protein